MDAVVKVSEVFGPTVQGEGPSTGRRCAFVRLGRCNLDCAWCDTPYTWDWSRFDPAEQLTDRIAVELAETVQAMDVRLCVITGGEPMLQRSALAVLVVLLRDIGIDVEIETNGTQSPVPLLGEQRSAGALRFNVSPKLSSSRVPRDKAWIEPSLRAFLTRAGGRTAWKFAVGSPMDWSDVLDFQAVYTPPRENVWIMPQTEFNGVVPLVTPAEVASWAINEGYNVSGRLHVDLWGNERGH